MPAYIVIFDFAKEKFGKFSKKKKYNKHELLEIHMVSVVIFSDYKIERFLSYDFYYWIKMKVWGTEMDEFDWKEETKTKGLDERNFACISNNLV